MKRLAVCLLLSTGILPAERVLWTATGSVASTTSVFSGAGFSTGQAVMVEFSYDSTAGEFPFTNIPILGYTETDYYENINLDVRICIAGSEWVGTIASGIFGSPHTVEVRDQTLNPDFHEHFIARVQEVDGGTFTAFPQSSGDGRDSVVLDFDALNTFDFVATGIASTAIDPGEITNAQGIITTGTTGSLETLAFTLDPASVLVQTAPTAVAQPDVGISAAGGNVTLSWMSENGVCYSIQRSTSPDAVAWTPFLTVPGDGTLKTPSFAQTGTKELFRVVGSR